MKKAIRIFAGLIFLLSLQAHAKTQSIISGTHDKPCTLHVSGKFDMGGYSVKNDHGMGLKSLDGILGLTHLSGNDLEYGINLFGGWATSLQGKLFSDNGASDGFKVGVNLSGRYMPQISEKLRFGALIGLGYSRLFGEGDKRMHDAFTFGDTNFEVGPSFMHSPNAIFSWGLALTYGMTEMRFGSEKASDRAKQYSNLHTIRVPIDFIVQVSDNIGLNLALEPGWRHLGGTHKALHGIFYDAAFGVNISL